MFKKPYLLFLSTIFLILLFLLAVYPIGMHLVVEEKTGKKLVDESIFTGDNISIKFIHSVEKVNVTETYMVQSDKKLLLKRAVYGSMGAGLPSDTSYNITLKDGEYQIENIDKIFNSVEFITGNIPKHSVIVHNTEYPIYSMSEEGKPLSLYIESFTVIDMIYNNLLMFFTISYVCFLE